MEEGSGILDRLLSSETKGELLILFHKNPGLVDTLEGVARRMGMLAKSVEEDAKDLVNLGVLATKRIGSSEVIFLNHERDKEVQEMVANYLRRLKRDG